MNFFTKKRLALGMNKRDLAAKVDVTPTTIGKWESGTLLPGPRVIPKLAKALKVPVDELVNQIGEMAAA